MKNKMKIFFIMPFLALVGIHGLYGQIIPGKEIKPINPLKEYNLKGKVKYCEETESFFSPARNNMMTGTIKNYKFDEPPSTNVP